MSTPAFARSSIIADNTAVDLGPDFSGTPQSYDHNLIGNLAGCSTVAARPAGTVCVRDD